MSAEISCDGCGIKCGDGETFKKPDTFEGYLDPCDYCAPCHEKFRVHDRKRRNNAFEAGAIYRDGAAFLRKEFQAANPKFKLPDAEMD